MSASVTARPLVAPLPDAKRWHRARIIAGAIVAVVMLLALASYGLDYYVLDAASRPLSPKHALLKPSGAIGLRLGMLGTMLFLGLYLYPIRKRWPWLAKQGNSKHWLDVHVLLGLAAPVVIAFHASFKFQGLAGVAFWIMVAVAFSGLVGRYLYAQIPRSLSAAELSLKEIQELQAQLAQTLAAQKRFSAAALESLLHFPAAEQVKRMPVLVALGAMVALDLRRLLRVMALRRHALGGVRKWLTLGGVLSSDNGELEKTIRAVRDQAALAKRILFLDRAHRVFQLWHVVHRPFSYSFSVLALVHILVVMMFGLM